MENSDKTEVKQEKPDNKIGVHFIFDESEKKNTERLGQMFVKMLQHIIQLILKVLGPTGIKKIIIEYNDTSSNLVHNKEVVTKISFVNTKEAAGIEDVEEIKDEDVK